MAIFAVFCGLPGTGKTTLARELSIATGGVHLNIDAIEEGLRASALGLDDMMDAAYQAAWRLAEENLSLGLPVIGDAVNPVTQARSGWRQVAHRTGCRLFEIEVLCSDEEEHRARIFRRHAGGVGPDWASVASRHFVRPTGQRIVIDTAKLSFEQALDKLIGATLG